MSVTIYYDGECPFCTNYVTYLRLKEAAGTPTLVDLRTDVGARDRFQEQGIDVDKGMVAEIDGTEYWGDDALHALALITGPSGMFNRLSGFLFSSPAVSKIAYPVLRAGRCLTLDLLGRHRMAAEDPMIEAKFQLFSMLFGFFSIFHVLSYPLYYRSFPPTFDFVVLLVLAVGLVLWQSSRALFIALMLASLVSGYIHAPVDSNHTILRNFVALGFVLTYGLNLLRASPWQRTFVDFSLVGRFCLLVMYFFGVFHKLNTDFLNPQASCAVVLWHAMPAPLSYLDNAFIRYLAIYGTLVIESAMIMALLVPRIRHLAVAVGVFFHLLLALSGFSVYLPFTSLAISLHLLFLSPDSAWRVMQSPVIAGFRSRLRQPAWMATALIFFVVMGTLVLAGKYTATTLMASLFIVPLCYAIVVYGAATEHGALSAGQRASSIGRFVATAIAAILFVNCLMPYMGLKTAQTMNMFSNLRVEGGVSNHLLFRDPPSMFHYLDDVAVITKATGSTDLEALVSSNSGIVRYDLLRQLRDNPGAVVSFRMNGVDHVDQSAGTMAKEIGETLFPAYINKVFNFIGVSMPRPTTC
jgi:predicted DCC family thiol-disulfide oxidoreductase YuxK